MCCDRPLLVFDGIRWRCVRCGVRELVQRRYVVWDGYYWRRRKARNGPY